MQHRRCITLIGTAADTLQDARALVVDLTDVLWVGPEGIAPRRVRRLLGASHDAVVLSLHEGLSADVLAQCAGFVRGGGALILRVPPVPVPSPGLVVEPAGRSDVTDRLWQRILSRFPPDPEPSPVSLPPRVVSGSPEQQRVVAAIRGHLRNEAPALISLTADRGRGKSAALGLAIRDLDRPVVVSADHPDAAAEVFRFAQTAPRFLPPTALLAGVDAGIILIDEAARLAVPLLDAIVRANPAACIVFATTIRGYEGTGRGFVLRFLATLEQHGRPVHHHTLHTPIRWRPDDPLEGRIFEALALDAEPATVVGEGEAVAVVLDRDRLAEDPQRLRDFFGLLVHAHYRTTPEDLHRILDAPNLHLHAMLKGGRVVVACMVAVEGGLSMARCEQLARGAARIRGHALPDTLISHAAATHAGTLTMIRSVRIATHPEHRRRGLAAALVESVHAHHRPDLFGTLFGATPSVLRLRRRLGYRLVRVGAARGSRTGEPTAVMIRPVSEAAHALVEALQADLAAELPGLVALMTAEGPLSPALIAALSAGLPDAEPPDPTRLAARLTSYLSGPCHFEAAALALGEAISESDLSGLPLVERGLVTDKVIRHASWSAAAELAGLSIPAAQRALKRALRSLLA
ncbi:MAG: tRNA(Met) cytidine acetyltransferase [Myxococcota bacterium]